jgi:NSS family neurotransmitter:Na+ symporter
MGLAFFKLSLGMGTMMTYGSYFRDDQNIPQTTVRVMAADLCVSMLAGIAIFPAVFTFGFEPATGPALVFITIPAVFSQIPGGQLLMIAFFVLASVAATGAMLSLMEVPVVILHERLGMSRAKATLMTIAGLMLLGSTCALTNNVLAGFKLFGMNMFDLFDFVSSNVLLPLGGILLAAFVSWVWGADQFIRAVSNNGTLANGGVARVVLFLLRYVSPLLILAVMLKGQNFF